MHRILVDVLSESDKPRTIWVSLLIFGCCRVLDAKWNADWELRWIDSYSMRSTSGSLQGTALLHRLECCDIGCISAVRQISWCLCWYAITRFPSSCPSSSCVLQSSIKGQGLWYFAIYEIVGGCTCLFRLIGIVGHSVQQSMPILSSRGGCLALSLSSGKNA